MCTLSGRKERSSDNRGEPMSIKTVLVTGANGFIGRLLTKALLTEDVHLRCLVRKAGKALDNSIETVQGDLLDPATLPAAMDGVDTAFYLVHSIAGGRAGVERRDRDAAENFVRAAEKAGVRRVIYLGGLGETGDDLSEHLKSRLEVADILRAGKFATTFLGRIYHTGGRLGFNAAD